MGEKVENIEYMLRLIYPDYDKRNDDEKDEANEFKKFLTDNYYEIIDDIYHQREEAAKIKLNIPSNVLLVRAIKNVKKMKETVEKFKDEDERNLQDDGR